jgi:hypothetical protein
MVLPTNDMQVVVAGTPTEDRAEVKKKKGKKGRIEIIVQ